MSRQRILVIGVGFIGERHLRCFQATERAEVGLVELDPARRLDVAQRYGVTRVFAELSTAVESGFDAAVICTPAHWHIPIALQLCEAGLPLLIEMPLSASLDQVDELQRRVAERQLHVAVADTWRAFPSLRFLREQVQSGTFGRPLLITVQAGQNFPTYRPAYRDSSYNDRKTGGGAIQDAITHLFAACEWVAGPLTQLCVDAAHQALEGVEIEDTVNVIARHGAVLASYSLNQFQKPNETTISVTCERGTLRLEKHRNTVGWLNEVHGAWMERFFGPIDRDAAYRSQALAFLDLLEGRAALTLCSLAEGCQTLRVNLAAIASAEERCWRDVSR